MQADISRPFRHPRKHYRRVLMQQGRVQLDADWNEQVDILLHYLQSLAADLTGPHGTPPRWDGRRPGTGFDVEEAERLLSDFLILRGHYYVDGILCENERVHRYLRQPDFFPLLLEDGNPLSRGGDFVVYLDVWERHITYVEDRRIREIALGGPDTTTRARTVWQVKVVPIGPGEVNLDELDEEPEEWLRDRLLDTTGVYELSRARLCARVRPDRPSTDPCRISPSSRYRGLENQLYRVEIHHGGRGRPSDDEDDEDEEGEDEQGYAEGRQEREPRVERREPFEGDDEEAAEAAEEEEEEEEEEDERRERPEPPRGGPTFKWSRENASVIYPIRSIAGTTVALDHLGRDDRLALELDDWVEIVDDVYDLHRQAELYRTTAPPDPVTIRVSLDHGLPSNRRLRHPFLRRWDQRAEHGARLRDGAIPIVEDRWIDLEDGIQVRFPRGGRYRTGDYWLIPARTVGGEIEWPRDEDGQPECLRPNGIVHHFAPLARIMVREGEIEVVEDYRRALLRTWERIEEEEDEGAVAEPEGKEREEEEAEEAEGPEEAAEAEQEGPQQTEEVNPENPKNRESQRAPEASSDRRASAADVIARGGVRRKT